MGFLASMTATTKKDHVRVLAGRDFSALLDVLKAKGYSVFGPTARDGAVVLDAVESVADLPRGLADEQSGGHYRLRDEGSAALFAYTTSAQSWKRFLHPPEVRLMRTERRGEGFHITSTSPALDAPMAFLGVRPCELAAMDIQDKVFANGTFTDPIYKARREGAVVIAANCTRCAETCFCLSLGTGPKAKAGFDLAFTELTTPEHVFVVEAGSEKGHALLDALPTRPDNGEAKRAEAALVKTQTRSLDSDHRALLADNREHPTWEAVAKRCLSCGNCTQVCPTCFCTTVEDVTDLNGAGAERVRKWDSCFSVDFSYIHGGPIRPGVASRYRQWISHKLTNWYDQFGTAGCTGCGRCITWCPVGIDITEETATLRGAKETDHDGS